MSHSNSEESPVFRRGESSISFREDFLLGPGRRRCAHRYDSGLEGVVVPSKMYGNPRSGQTDCRRGSQGNERCFARCEAGLRRSRRPGQAGGTWRTLFAV